MNKFDKTPYWTSWIGQNATRNDRFDQKFKSDIKIAQAITDTLLTLIFCLKLPLAGCIAKRNLNCQSFVFTET